MFRSSLAVIAVLLLSVWPASAQRGETKTPAPTAAAASSESSGTVRAGERPRTSPAPSGKPGSAPASPEVSTTPAPERRGFFDRVFGPKKTKPIATPPPPASTPVPTPTPRPRKRRAASSTPSPAAQNAEQVEKGTAGAKPKTRRAKTAATAEEPPAETSEPAPSLTTSEQPDAAAPAGEEAPVRSTPAPKKGRRGKAAASAEEKPASQPPADADPEALEDWKYNQAKTAAQDDPEVRKLKEKADASLTDGRPARR
jgi:hypothetical protein